MTLLTAFPLQVIILYLILYSLFSLAYCRITYLLSSSHIPSPRVCLTCKGTSVHSLTFPLISHSPHVHIYFPSSPLYNLQGPYL
jgi:hypothetical protein